MLRFDLDGKQVGRLGKADRPGSRLDGGFSFFGLPTRLLSS